jgi:hypothetical protein
MEPVSGFEPLTCRLQKACSIAASPLAAPFAQLIALMGLISLGFSGGPFHEPFHAGGAVLPLCVRLGQKNRQAGRQAGGTDETTGVGSST